MRTKLALALPSSRSPEAWAGVLGKLPSQGAAGWALWGMKSYFQRPLPESLGFFPFYRRKLRPGDFE